MSWKEKTKVAFIFFLALCCLLSSCSKKVESIPEGAELIPNAYAKNFNLYRLLDSSYLITTNSAKGGEGGYYKIPSAGFSNLPVYMSCPSAMSLWASAADSKDKLSGIKNIKFTSTKKEDWHLDYVLKSFENKNLEYIGKYSSPDFEELLTAQVALAVESTMITHAPKIKEKLEALGIVVFVDKSSYEESPLARLEWIKVYGILQGKFEEACRFFNEEEKKIISIKTSSEGKGKNLAFFSVNMNGTVMFRQRGDYIDKMIGDAGASCLFPETKKNQSAFTNISFESFYLLARDADYLIYNGSINSPLKSLDELLEKNNMFKDFKAVKNKCVWRVGPSFYQATDQTSQIMQEFAAIFSDENKEEATNLYLEKVK